MTHQVYDTIRYAGSEYTLVGANGSGLFSVADHGFRPASVWTACWRGAWLQYRVENDRLELRRVSTFDEEDAPPFLGRAPTRTSWGTSYNRLAIPVAFTGGLLAARRLVRRRGFSSWVTYSWDYECVLELHFAAGALERVLDHSDALREFRGRGLDPTAAEEAVRGVYARAYEEIPDGPLMW